MLQWQTEAHVNSVTLMYIRIDPLSNDSFRETKSLMLAHSPWAIVETIATDMTKIQEE